MSERDAQELNRLWYELGRRHRRQRWITALSCLIALGGMALRLSWLK
jgi:hypothetical protein